MMARRFGAAALGLIGGGLLSMIVFALLVSIFDLGFQSVMPAALIVGSICGVVGFCFPGLGASLFWMVDW
jgi:hypothetical protein